MKKPSEFAKWIQKHSIDGYSYLANIMPVAGTSYMVGFFICEKLSDKWRQVDSFTIRGFICSDIGFSDDGRVYVAYVNFSYADSMARLDDNVVDPYYRNRGIGSLGLDYIKSFLRALGCTTLTGTKHPIPNTPDEMAKLTAFYEKNGFQQLADNKIIFHF